MSYFCESFEYQPINLFLNSNSADIIQSHGDRTFNLRRNVSLPSSVTGYVSLNELTIPNTNYNINSTNNKLNLQVIKNNTNVITQVFTITPGNYTVTQFKDALNAAFEDVSVDVTFNSITVDYNDKTNCFLFTSTASAIVVILADSTMNSVIGFEYGLVEASRYTCAQGSYKSNNGQRTCGPITLDTNDTLMISFFPFTNITTIKIAPGTYTGATIVAELNAKLLASNIQYPIVASFNSTINILTLTNSTTNIQFKFISPGTTSFIVLGFPYINQSTVTGTNCTLTSTKQVDLSGVNSFYFSTNLGIGNYNFLSKNNTSGANILAKIQLTTDSTGIEFYNNLTSFKPRFYDSNISSLHIVLYDEDFNLFVPQSDWSCVLEMTFFEKYDLTTKLKQNNLLFSK